MQISTQEVEKVLRRTLRGTTENAPVRSVEELAGQYDVEAADVAASVESIRSAEEDPWRARRVRELMAKVEAGTYHVEAQQIVDMAERRALADRACEL